MPFEREHVYWHITMSEIKLAKEEVISKAHCKLLPVNAMIPTFKINFRFVVLTLTIKAENAALLLWVQFDSTIHIHCSF